MIFYKYHGTGNDFILIDNRAQSVVLNNEQISFLCKRHFGIGADGLILLENHEESDFFMRYYNKDGSTGTMCGNGGRCAVLFARQIGIISEDETKFHAADGLHTATIMPEGTIALKMNVNPDYQLNGKAYILDTGSPHYVRFTYNLDEMNVRKEGRIVRNSAQYKEKGINVNFVEEERDGIFVRTYERGVENETLSCGTGVTAAALAKFHKERMKTSSVINVRTLGGKLQVQIEVKGDEGEIERVWLIGPAKQVYIGEVNIS